jgi:HD-like signal output (HDOD) protein/ActR/RegA family two-component response regulator
MNATKQILYVASQTARDTRFEAELSTLNPRWDVSVSDSADSALARIQETPFDAVVANDQLSDMDGFRLLDTIQQRHPHTHRLIVADLANPKIAVKSAGTTHQCLPKPLDRDMLRTMLERVFSLNIWLSNPTVRELLGRMKVVPSPPDLYVTIARALRDPESSLQDVSTRAAQDPAMSGKLLQLANSAALGLRHKVVNVEEAIGYLGLEMTRSLVLLAHTFSYCNRSRGANSRIDRLWKHSLNTGSLARRLAREEKSSREMADEAFLAGLLHDIGELLFLVNLPQEYQGVLKRAHENGLPLWKAEFEHFGATHAELGAELMAIWNLPLSVVEALALHHHPSKLISSNFGALAAVHAADALEQELNGSPEFPDGITLDTNYLADLGLADRIDGWREACREELRGPEK